MKWFKLLYLYFILLVFSKCQEQSDGFKKLDDALNLRMDPKLQNQLEQYYQKINSDLLSISDFEDLNFLVDQELGISNNTHTNNSNQNSSFTNTTSQNASQNLPNKIIYKKVNLFDLLKQSSQPQKKKSIFDFLSSKQQESPRFAELQTKNVSLNEQKIQGDSLTEQSKQAKESIQIQDSYQKLNEKSLDPAAEQKLDQVANQISKDFDANAYEPKLISNLISMSQKQPNDQHDSKIKQFQNLQQQTQQNYLQKNASITDQNIEKIPYQTLQSNSVENDQQKLYQQNYKQNNELNINLQQNNLNTLQNDLNLQQQDQIIKKNSPNYNNQYNEQQQNQQIMNPIQLNSQIYNLSNESILNEDQQKLNLKYLKISQKDSDVEQLSERIDNLKLKDSQTDTSYDELQKKANLFLGQSNQQDIQQKEPALEELQALAQSYLNPQASQNNNQKSTNPQPYEQNFLQNQSQQNNPQNNQEYFQENNQQNDNQIQQQKIQKRQENEQSQQENKNQLIYQQNFIQNYDYQNQQYNTNMNQSVFNANDQQNSIFDAQPDPNIIQKNSNDIIQNIMKSIQK